MGKGIRAKKSKKPAHKTDRGLVFKATEALIMSQVVRILDTVYEFDTDKLTEFFEAYDALMEEIVDGRNSVPGMIQECVEITGITIDDVLYGGK